MALPRDLNAKMSYSFEEDGTGLSRQKVAVVPSSSTSSAYSKAFSGALVASQLVKTSDGVVHALDRDWETATFCRLSPVPSSSKE